jgi:uncharacterized protein (TIGR03663 family)
MQRSASLDQPPIRIAIWPGTLRLETVLYLAIMLAAIVSRFWDLGAGALHHDESMHAYYSWRFETGHGYIHNPLLHGPLLFFLTALSFFFAGESDTTARIMPALFGTALVGLPWLLRSPRLLGRWGALSASALLLISPSILYYSRHLRHDLFTLTLTLLLAICILRYLERPQRRWIITGAAAIGLMLANHEIIFAILAIFFGYLYAALAIDRLAAWRSDPHRCTGARVVIAAHVWLIAGGLAAFTLAPNSRIDELITIPWDHPTPQQQHDYYVTVATSPLVIAWVLIALSSLALLIYGLRRVRNPALLADAADHTVAAGVRALWRDQQGLGIAILLAIALFTTLFTTLFTNLHGLASSTYATDGTLLYWLGQHDVRRGHQPWFYFLLLTPQYELFVVLLTGPMTIAIAVRALWWRVAGIRRDSRQFFLGFLTTWFAGLFVALSLAGEKMPWLIVHFTLPGLLLAAAAIGWVIERAIATGWPRWVWPVAFAVAMVAMLQVHLATRMTYLEGDIPRDMLIYTQTAPDLPMLVGNLEQLSYDAYGDLSLRVDFGGEATWPLWWYLRDFPNHQPAVSPASAQAIPPDTGVYIVNAPDLNNPDAINRLDTTFAGYTRLTYVIRWAYPETGYRQFAIAPELDPKWSAWTDASQPHGFGAVIDSIIDSLRSAVSPGERDRLYRLWMYRDVTTPLTQWSTWCFVYVRNDLLPLFNQVRFGAP